EAAFRLRAPRCFEKKVDRIGGSRLDIRARLLRREQDPGEGHPARRGRRHRLEHVVAVAEGERFAHYGAVAREIVEGRSLGGERARQTLRDGAAVEAVRTLLGELREGPGEIGLDDPRAFSLRTLAVAEDRRHARIARELAVAPAEHARLPGAELEAVLREVERGSDELLERHAAELASHQLETGDTAGHAHGGFAASAPLDHAIEALAREALRRDFAKIHGARRPAGS